MKKLFSFVVALVITSGVFVSANAQETDTVGPFLVMDNPGYVVSGDEYTLTLTAYDESELADNVITAEDFEINGRAVKIISVSEAYNLPENSQMTGWSVTIKGVSSGNCTVAVSEGAVSDIHGNRNARTELTEVQGMSRIYYFFWTLWQRIQYFFTHAI